MKTKFYGRLIIALLVVTLALIAPVASYNLNLNDGISATITGSDSVEGISSPAGTATLATGSIQAAVDAAIDGATIYLLAKIYAENVMVDKSLGIKGTCAGSTIVDGDQKDSVFMIGANKPNVDVILSGMTIRDGLARWGDQIGRHGGGGIFNNGRLTVKNCDFENNMAIEGGGIYNTKNGMVTVKNSIFEGNVEYQGGNGASIFNLGTMDLKNCIFLRNTANTAGNIFNGVQGIVNVKNCIIAQNTAYFCGAGFENSGKLTIKNSWITDNTAGHGTAIDNWEGGQVDVINSYITNNRAVPCPTDAGSGAGIDNHPGGTVNVINSYITQNIASGSGGGINNYPTATVTVTNSEISGNTANSGGGIYNGGTLNLVRDVIKENAATGGPGSGGGIYNVGTMTKKACIVKGNQPEDIAP